MIDQSPGPGASAGKGSVISLTVSKGPKTSTVPDVTSYDLGTAEQTLKSSGFRDTVTYQHVTDPNADGVVLEPDAARRRTAAQEHGRSRSPSASSRSGGTTTATTTTDSVTRRLRVALLAGGRSSEHDISLAVGALGARGARPGALRRRQRRHRPRRPLEP